MRAVQRGTIVRRAQSRQQNGPATHVAGGGRVWKRPLNDGHPWEELRFFLAQLPAGTTVEVRVGREVMYRARIAAGEDSLASIGGLAAYPTYGRAPQVDLDLHKQLWELENTVEPGVLERVVERTVPMLVPALVKGILGMFTSMPKKGDSE